MQNILGLFVQSVSRCIDQFLVAHLDGVASLIPEMVAQHLLDIGRAGSMLADQPVDFDEERQRE